MAPAYRHGRLLPAMPTKRHPEAAETYSLGRSFALAQSQTFPDPQVSFSKKVRVGSHRVPQEFVAKSKSVGEVFVRVYDPLYVSIDNLLPTEAKFEVNATAIVPSSAPLPSAPSLPDSSASALQLPQIQEPVEITSQSRDNAPEGLWSREQIVQATGKIEPVPLFFQVLTNQAIRKVNLAPFETRAALAYRYFSSNLCVFETLCAHHPALVPELLDTAVIRFQRELPEDETCHVLITKHTPGQRLHHYSFNNQIDSMKKYICATLKEIVYKSADVNVFFANLKLSQFIVTPAQTLLLVEMEGGDVTRRTPEYKKEYCERVVRRLMRDLNRTQHS